MLRANPGLDAIFGCCDFVPTGAVPAIRSARKNIRVYALHGIPSSISLARSGLAVLEVADYQRGGIVAIDVLAAHFARNARIPKRMPGSYRMSLVDRTNAAKGFPYPTSRVLAPFKAADFRKAIDAATKPKVLYLGRALGALTASGNKGNYSAWYIELVGGLNASADVEGNGTTISPEQIAEWNPDVILLNSFEPELDLSRVYDDPILSLTNAAQEKRVYKMPLGGYRWDPPSQESPLTWMWLANLLHPEVFQYDLRGEMKKAYKTLYNYDLTDEDIDGILWLAMQSDATNYAQFKAR